MNKIIAISGLKGSGKDESALMLQYCLSVPKWLRTYKLYKLLRNLVPTHYKITSFARVLKESLAVLLGIDVQNFEDRNFKENWYIHFPTLDITNNPPKNLILNDKQFNRRIQTDVKLVVNNYLTIREVLQLWGTEVVRNILGDKFWVLRTLNTDDDVIISDLRFKVEYESVKSSSGITIYINRDLEPGMHQSESECIELWKSNKFDFVVNNTGTLNDLFVKISEISDNIKNGV